MIGAPAALASAGVNERLEPPYSCWVPVNNGDENTEENSWRQRTTSQLRGMR